MRNWLTFWTLWLLVAGASFAAITVVVIVKGARDLRDMFTGLKLSREE